MNQYSPDNIYLGIDVHKKSYAVTAVHQGSVIKKCQMAASPNTLVDFCNKYFPKAKIQSCYEAGFCGFHLHRALIERGIQNIVVHPASIEIEARNRVKNDTRDSMKMAIQLSQGRLKGIHVPSPEREDFRTVSRLRDTLMKERIRTGNRIKSLLYCNGFIGHQDKIRVSEKWLKELLKHSFSPELAYTIKTQVKLWIQLSEAIKETVIRLDGQAEQDSELEAIYTSLPGIGPTSARVLINELGDLSQFPNQKCLFSFLGLTPSEHSSGEHRWLGHISRQGRPCLRKILVQCAWVAIKYDHSLKVIFEEMEKRTGARKAIVAIARKLMGRAHTCVREKRKYQTITESGEAVIQTSEDTKEVLEACQEAVHLHS